MIEPGNSPVEMHMVKAGRGRSLRLLFAKTSRQRGAMKKLPVDDALKQAAFGMLLCFAGFMIVALVVEYLRGRI